ncbi:MAG: hypothetical protein Q4B40_00500 [Clostridia bacterium]|nr:hypothetical protein [Clostridia bacterium]
MNVKKYNVHISALLAICVLGNGCILLPFLNSAGPILTFLLCGAAVLITTLVTLPVINRAFSQKGILFYVLSVIIIAISVYGVITTVNDYLSFLNTLDIAKAAAILLLILLLWALCFCSSSAFLKFSLLFGVITAALIVLLFIMSAGIYDIKNINLTPIKLDFMAAADAFLKCFNATVPSLCFAVLSNHKANAKNTLSGVVIGLVLSLLCLLQSLLVLGTTAAGQSLPYLTAVSAYSSGQLYIRQDGFVWFIFFSTATIKTALCLKAVWVIIKRLFDN